MSGTALHSGVASSTGRRSTLLLVRRGAIPNRFSAKCYPNQGIPLGSRGPESKAHEQSTMFCRGSVEFTKPENGACSPVLSPVQSGTVVQCRDGIGSNHAQNAYNGDDDERDVIGGMRIFDIPYRSLLPAKVDGLLVAGGRISADHDRERNSNPAGRRPGGPDGGVLLTQKLQ
jgi:hypothetical protein